MIASIIRRILFAVAFSSVAVNVFADKVDDARQLVVEGDFWQARKLLNEAETANPKLRQNAQFQYLLGVCEFEDGNYDEAEKLLSFAKQKGYRSANLYLGRLAFLNYDFDTASELYSDFAEHQEKTGVVGAEMVKEFEQQLTAAENAMSRVEDIVVIDSLALPKDTFFKSYRLPASAGKLLLPFEIPFEEYQGGAVSAYLNEAGDYMMWGQPDSIGNVRLLESLRLVDGTWQEPTELPDMLNQGGYADYPFMMPDGVTLYYASDGAESMGGYDIFVVTRDPSTGEYLQPQNVGMPFNSPYDDYLLAIDEENGVGWWATDRNNLGDKVTVYVYLTNDLRKNYDSDSEDIIDRARLSDYKSTWKEDDSEKYEEMLAHLATIDPDHVEKKPEFHLPVWGGKYYTTQSDFKSHEAAEAMKRYLAAQAKLKDTQAKLDSLRKRWTVNHADNVREEILALEKDMEQQRTNLISIRSDIYRYEKEKK